MPEIIVKNNEDLNRVLTETETKLAAVETEVAKIAEIETMKTETLEMKTIMDNLTKRIEEIKEAQQIKYLVKSDDERMHELGRLLFAIQKQDMKTVFEMGGRLNTKASTDDWKGESWTIGGEEKAATNLGTPLRGDAATGSILIPEEYANEILRVPGPASGMMGKVRTIPMATRKINYGATLVGAAFAWVTNEVTAKSEKNPTFSEVELECETAAGWVAMTEEFMEDTFVDMAAYLSDIFREAWALEFDTQCLVANAAPFTGIMRDAGVNLVTMGAGDTTVADITTDYVLELLQSVDTQQKRNGASFVMHVTVLDQLKFLKDDDGNPIFAPAQGVQPQTLFGYPIIFSDSMPDYTGAVASTRFMAFGNPKYLLHGNRVGMEFRLFNQTSDAMIYDRNFFRCRLRQGFVAGVPGAWGCLRTAAA